jgi:hypothetical protein
VTTSPYLQIHQVVDEVCTAGRMPAGGRGALFAAIDCLRRRSAPVDHVRAAESISLALHHLESALRDGDSIRQEAARAQLRLLGADWLRSRLPLARH